MPFKRKFVFLPGTVYFKQQKPDVFVITASNIHCHGNAGGDVADPEAVTRNAE